MNKTLETFNAQKTGAIELLIRLQKFLRQGNELGVDIDPSVTTKLEKAIQDLDGEKLKVALIGGFSEGKTAIAAAWTEHLDKASMKISHQESSNEVKVYEVGSELVLVDTPGLFGFKEQENRETGELEKYKDLTKKYVSESHLVLYVMNSTNPIKESHKDDLNWLFRELNLLPRTVFVLSLFDEVADVEDDSDYQDKLAIKKNNVRDRLRELIGLSEQEGKELLAVGVAANPFDMGIEYWLSNIDKFKALSRISTLQDATNVKIQKNGGYAEIVNETKRSIIRDVLFNQLPVAIENNQKIAFELEKLEESNNHLQKQLGSTKNRIDQSKISLRTFIADYFSDLILQTQGLSMETAVQFFEREVGSEGVMIATRIQNEFDRQLNFVNLEINKIQASFQTEINHFNTTVKMFGKQGLDYVIQSKVINSSTVIAARDGLVTVAKTIGIDIGKMLKFKPWGAVNLSKGINGALAVVGVALEVWDTMEQMKREKAFQDSKAQMVSNFNQQRSELLELVNSAQFLERFFPDYLELQANFADLNNKVVGGRQMLHKFNEWKQYGEVIDVEFKESLKR